MPTPQLARRRLVRSVITPLVLGLGLAVAVLLLNEVSQYQARRASAQVVESLKTRQQFSSLRRTILDAETAQRGYMLTGNPSYLQAHKEAVDKLGPIVDRLRDAYSRNDKAAPEAFTLLARHIQRKIAEMEIGIRLRRDGGDSTAWQGVLQSEMGKELMDAINDEIETLIGDLESTYQNADARLKRALSVSRLSVLLLTVVAAVAFIIHLFRNEQHVRKEIALQKDLKDERDQLDEQVRKRTAALRNLATHLQNVQETERSHLARELHDELGSMLTAAKLDTARLGKMLPPENKDASTRLQHLNSTIDQVIAIKRRIIEDLRPSSLQHLGLVNALEHMTQEFAQRSGIAVTHALQKVELGEDAQLTLYRVVQEALTNIAKYAQATQVHLQLQPLPPDAHHPTPTAELRVEDNGKGFDVDKTQINKHGLMGMRHRIEAIEGTLDLHSQPGQGTHITARLPLETAPALPGA
ncbi:MAG: CHASE3 domain-containing protein [Brachymonas sp.]|nr:CHASE3 domain-containing protein [Brachymonas sp.]